MSISTEDRSAILDLVSEYAYAFDEDRIANWLNCSLMMVNGLSALLARTNR